MRWRVKNRSRAVRWGLMALMFPVLIGCTDQDEDGEHVWQEQTRALDKAEEVEQQMQESTDARRREIERQTE